MMGFDSEVEKRIRELGLREEKEKQLREKKTREPEYRVPVIHGLTLPGSNADDRAQNRRQSVQAASDSSP